MKLDPDTPDGHLVQRLDPIIAYEAVTGFECIEAGAEILRSIVNLNPVMTEIDSTYNFLVFLVFKSSFLIILERQVDDKL